MAEAFEALGLRAGLAAAVAELGFAEPLEIQQQAIPAALAGKDVVGISETGSGKTHAYALPIFERLKAIEESEGVEARSARPRALVMTPTRELADQVASVLKQLSHQCRLRVREISGGVERKRQRRDLGGAFEVLVGTPGRLQRYIDKGELSLESVRVLVLDEADQLFAMGFLQELDALLARIPEERQLLMFSATLPKPVQRLITERFEGAEIVRSKAAHKPVASLRTEQRQVAPKHKFEEVGGLLKELKGRGFIFVNAKDRCDALAAHLADLGMPVSRLHAGLEAKDRRRQMKAFRDGEARALVTTDVGARGLDIVDIGWILNVDLPRSEAAYLHRIGRTARIGLKGLVIDFVTNRDAELVKTLRERRIRQAPLALDEVPKQAWRAPGQEPKDEDEPPRKGGSQGRGGGRQAGPRQAGPRQAGARGGSARGARPSAGRPSGGPGSGGRGGPRAGGPRAGGARRDGASGGGPRGGGRPGGGRGGQAPRGGNRNRKG